MSTHVTLREAPTTVTNVAFAGTGTTPARVNALISGIGDVVFKPFTNDCYILFGGNASMAVATASNAFHLAANEVFAVKITKYTAYFSVVQGTGAGTLQIYVPGQNP